MFGGKTTFGGKSDALTSISRRFLPDGTPINKDGTPRLRVTGPDGMSERSIDSASYGMPSRRKRFSGFSDGTGMTGRSARTFKTGYSGATGRSYNSGKTWNQSQASSYLGRDDDDRTNYSYRSKNSSRYPASSKGYASTGKPSGHYFQSDLARSELASTAGDSDYSHGSSALTARSYRTNDTRSKLSNAILNRSQFSKASSNSNRPKLLSDSDFNVPSASGLVSSFHVPASSHSGMLGPGKAQSNFSSSGFGKTGKPLKLSPDNLLHLTGELFCP